MVLQFHNIHQNNQYYIDNHNFQYFQPLHLHFSILNHLFPMYIKQLFNKKHLYTLYCNHIYNHLMFLLVSRSSIPMSILPMCRDLISHNWPRWTLWSSSRNSFHWHLLENLHFNTNSNLYLNKLIRSHNDFQNNLLNICMYILQFSQLVFPHFYKVINQGQQSNHRFFRSFLRNNLVGKHKYTNLFVLLRCHRWSTGCH